MTTDIALNDTQLMKDNRLNDSLFSKDLAPHYMKLSSQLAQSAMVPKAYQGKPQDLFIAMAMGYQIGLSVEQAIQAIAVINGKPCLWGDDMLALCMNHPDFMDIIEEPMINENAVVTGYKCTIKRRGMTDHCKPFTLEMAKKAGLLGKTGPWTQYPERMLQLRARAFALRDRFPDALKGIKSREEVEDYIDVEYKVVDGSRTEFLKKDLLTKKDYSVETVNTEPNNIHSSMEDIQVTQETDSMQRPEAMGDSRNTEDSARDINIISTEQANEITKLLDEKAFDKERIDKMLQYYEVQTINELTKPLADHLIAQLNKA